MQIRFLVLLILTVQRAAASDLEFVTQDLPWAISGREYAPAPIEVRASGACPMGGVGFSIASGALPKGVELSRLGYFSGLPKAIGKFEFTIRVTNGCAWAAKKFALTVAAAPVLTVTPAKVELPGDGKDPTIRVSATWPRLAYRASSGANWLKLTPEHGLTPDEGQNPGDSALADLVHLQIDPSNLKPGHYTATVTITAWQAAQPKQVTVDLTVE